MTKNNKSMYDIQPIDFTKIHEAIAKARQKANFWFIGAAIIIFAVFGFSLGLFLNGYFYSAVEGYLKDIGSVPISTEQSQYVPQTSQEQAVIDAVRQYSPAVVSIVVSKDVPVMEEYFYNPFEGFDIGPEIQIPQYRQNGTERQEIGGGSGFIVSADGLVLTNKHVVLDDEAEYTVFTNDGQKFSAKVLAKDPVQDLAVMKIEPIDAKPFPVVKFGDSDNLQIGQSVIAIGNALGEFRNTVSVGVISGLGRTVSASGAGDFTEVLEDIIQTDAAINKGNSGGPLLNLKGEVIGINTAVAEAAQSIGFAIPITRAKKDIEQVSANGKIVYPFLGIRYVLVTADLKEKNELPVDYGAWIKKGEKGEVAITKDSAADKAGIKAGDIILEINSQKITQDNSLSKMISRYNPGDAVTLKVLRDGQESDIQVTLGERP